MTGRPWDPRDELSRQDEPIPNATGVTPPYGFPPREQRVDTRHAADGLGAKQQALTPGTDFQIEGIGFDVRSIAIDNPSGGWWYVVNAGAWVPPYWVGRIFTVIPSQNVRILSSAPGGFTQGYQAGEQAMATFYDAEIGPDDGEQIEGPAGSSDLNVTIVGPLDTPSDENANMAGVATAAFNKVFDPSLGGAGLWTRMRQVVGDAVAKTGLLAVVGMGWNGATYDRLKSTTAGTIGVLRIAAVSGNVDGDGQGSGVNSMMNDAGATVFPGFVPYGYNGATKDRLRSNLVGAGNALTGQLNVIPMMRDGASTSSSLVSLLFGLATPGVGTVRTGRATLWTRITTNTTTVVKGSAGILNRIVIPVALTGAVTIYDNTSAAGTIINVLPIGTVGSFTFETAMATGITIVTAAADEVGVGYF